MRFRKKDPKLKKFYTENGFAIITDLLESSNFSGLKEDMNYIFESAFKEHKIPNDSKWPEDDEWTGGLPHKALQKLHSSHKSSFGNCWDAIRLILDLQQFSNIPEIIDILKNIGISLPSLEVYPAIRIDMPFDDSRNVSWHQEWRYSFGSLNSATLWIPMSNLSAKEGTLKVIPKSHLLGLIKIKPADTIIFYEIDFPELDESKAFTVEMNYGEILLFSNFLLHSSSKNKSNLCRYTIQIRFNDLSCPYFKKNGWPRAFLINTKKNLISQEKDFSEVRFTI
tara:strand:- start:387 stop:1229 length:843 start_codon:yes stop_codon:yes gene_type:complete